MRIYGRGKKSKVLCAFAVAAMLFFIASRTSEEEKICAFVKGHESELEEISMQQLSGNHPTISYKEVTVDGVFENSNDKPIVQFSYTGRGLVPSSKYYGFYYSPSDTPSAYQNVDIGLEVGDGAWEWHQADGDNGGVTKKIKDRWYYYESWF